VTRGHEYNAHSIPTTRGRLEASPSTGWRETAAVMHVPNPHTAERPVATDTRGGDDESRDGSPEPTVTPEVIA